VVAASVGGSLSTDVILLMGFANLIADGLSMGFGDYLSSQAEFEYTRAEHKREKWELDNYPEGEKQEMVELYVARGMTQADAESVIEVMSKYKNFFLDVMMVEELGLMPPDESDSPAKNGMVTFVAFVVFGFIPLMSYVLAGATGASDVANFVAACVLTACTMLALGAAKAKFTNQSMVKSALLMLLNGGMAAVAAYLVSWGIAEAMGGGQRDLGRESFGTPRNFFLSSRYVSYGNPR
jgi:VIT1/CCC1 family predicted Fe2+/Mn2+ transporter